MGPAIAADGEDRDDMRVVELGNRLRLDPEPLQFQRVQRRGSGKDFQRDAAPQRDLLGLVDDAHPAAADLANEPILAQDRVGRQGILGTAGAGRFEDARLRRRVDEFHDVEADRPASRQSPGSDSSSSSRDGRLPASSSARYAARAEATCGSSREPSKSAEMDAVGVGVASAMVRAHCRSPSRPRSWRRARTHMFLTLSSVRSIRRATSGKLKPFEVPQDDHLAIRRRQRLDRFGQP